MISKHNDNPLFKMLFQRFSRKLLIMSKFHIKNFKYKTKVPRNITKHCHVKIQMFIISHEALSAPRKINQVIIKFLNPLIEKYQ